ncbi:uncharacterized protein LOC114850981 [Betta splendens]|uniref:Uncharacterized protein LOC114850981 n=1 Tax=Betta splendens TaxID=158456 RepID=A0A6P7LU41_BETSP|nr:uncharacterized protein LOC114850981 [Betta splendens]
MDARRTVVVSGVPDLLPGHRMRDKLTVHFQSRRRSRGGDVDAVEFPTDVRGLAFVTFDRAADAEAVALKEQQILTDAAFPEEHALTVFPFTTDVFFYVSGATVDLSMFDGDQASLIQSLRSAHRSLRFQVLPRERKALVEGPFSAIRALRADLVSRTGRLKPSVKPGALPPNPRVISHHQSVGPVSRSDSGARREPGGSNGLSAPLQSAGERSEVQSRRSQAKSPTSARQSAHSFYDTGSEAEEAPKAGSRPRLTSGRGAGPAQAAATRRYREAEDGPKRPPVDGAVQKHTPADWAPATKTRTRLDWPGPESPLKEVSSSYAYEDHPQDTCIWVDSYIFRYIEKFDKQYKKYLRGLSASVEEAEGSDLVQIRLAGTDPCEGPARVQEALARLNSLVELWQWKLRVYEICYNNKKHPKEKVMHICNDVEVRNKYDNVLYMVDETKVKIVGSLSCSYLFYFTVKQRLECDSI